ncbi:MAG: phenylalanine--tRNA ligase subunit beta [Desulfotomaculales bacterium]
MRVSLKWLQEFVDIPVTVTELADRLTMAGLAVDAIEEPWREISDVVTGRVMEVSPHPHADRLLVCRVDVGRGEDLVIVTGATNMREGDIVPVALEGARLVGGATIKRSKLRGVVSQGMMCAADELGIGEDHTGILILPPGTPVGVDVKEYLGLDDVILEIDLTPNRGDCLSVLGVAREVAAILEKPLRNPFEAKESEPLTAGRVPVDIEDPALCRRYVARLAVNVRIGPSPLWMQRRLHAAGIRPISNVVDITNYVMLELGQPLHAFDYDTLAGGRIIVRRAVPGETLVTLDRTERRLTPDMLVIADAEKAVAVAGVMGGLATEVTEKTTNALLESAWFDPSSVRRTSRQLGLRSEASLRFEKGVDLKGCLRGANRAMELIESTGAGEVVPGAVDQYPGTYVPRTVIVRPERVGQILGTEVAENEIESILDRLGFRVRKNPDAFLVQIPSYRVDIQREIDLIEEVARLHGYDRVPESLPFGNTTPAGRRRHQALFDRIRDIMVACGLTEAITYSFISPVAFDRLRLPVNDPLRRTLRLANPLSEDQSIMRTTLLPGLLDTLVRNYQRQVSSAALFEIGRVFIPVTGEQLPEERTHLGMALMGETPRGWNQPSRPLDFFYLKGVLEVLAGRLGIEISWEKGAYPFLHPGRTSLLTANSRELGWMGEVHPDVTGAFDLPGRVVACELDLETLLQVIPERRETRFKGLPRFPSVNRDVAIVIKEKVPVAAVTETIREAGGDLLKELYLFDVFKGRRIPAGCHSLAFALRFRSPDRTLTEEEVNKRLEAILKALETRWGAQLRSG